MHADEKDDYWTLQSSPLQKQLEPLLKTEAIDGVEPLGNQFAIDSKESVPELLKQPLFGQPALTSSELGRARSAPTVLGPLNTYALLDAARLPFILTELLEASGLTSQSLFDGKAQEEMGEQAPYLVQLEEANSFTRKLFTDGSGMNGLWGLGLGIFLRSRSSFASVRKHMRKMTRVQIEKDNTWNYFRFWEPKMVPYFLRGTDVANQEAFLGFDLELHTIDHAGTWLRMYLVGEPRLTPPARIIIKDRDKTSFQRYGRRQYVHDLKDWLYDSFGNPSKIEDTERFLRREIRAAHKGFRTTDKRIIAHCVAASWLLGESAMTTKRVKTSDVLVNARGAKQLYDRAYKYRYMVED
ncbi:uncharacterized protein DUF4123 [Litoreibacter halocynthiae]|uniref:Uncharacterized protein DUF4123 n=1 Tax=Litoreibacter halocynthiae TaxID=1242689 RepID=A0A4R7LL25_9RHOB|nr:DUF4123 domain-containing protein [Litoreibacter halocynthiae]TDT74800.1 uncharacterized protein DUF4123 [Litoreibacter halocynthiae]